MYSLWSSTPIYFRLYWQLWAVSYLFEFWVWNWDGHFWVIPNHYRSSITYGGLKYFQVGDLVVLDISERLLIKMSLMFKRFQLQKAKVCQYELLLKSNCLYFDFCCTTSMFMFTFIPCIHSIHNFTYIPTRKWWSELILEVIYHKS